MRRWDEGKFDREDSRGLGREKGRSEAWRKFQVGLEAGKKITRKTVPAVREEMTYIRNVLQHARQLVY